MNERFIISQYQISIFKMLSLSLSLCFKFSMDILRFARHCMYIAWLGFLWRSAADQPSLTDHLQSANGLSGRKSSFSLITLYYFTYFMCLYSVHFMCYIIPVEQYLMLREMSHSEKWCMIYTFLMCAAR